MAGRVAVARRRPIRSVTLPALHPGQCEIRDSQARFIVLACGRRWGKTKAAAAICTRKALRGLKNWWIAPSYLVSNIGWREIVALATQIPGVQVQLGDRLVVFPGGGFIQVRSAAGQTGLRGEGLDFVVIDECGFVGETVWTEAVRPALTDRKGGALLISTPTGRNWFWRAWMRGQEGEEQWRSWQFPTVTNPYIDPEEVEEARRTLPERSFLQEYEAQFLDDAGAVFRNVIKASQKWLELPGPLEGHDYVMGVDWAKHEDFTVLTVMDSLSQRVVAWDRFNQVDYRLQKGRLVTLAQKWGCTMVLAESNAMGEPLIEELEHEGLPVRGFRTTNASKKEIIEGLALAFERDEIVIPAEPVLTAELQAFEMDRTPGGLLRYQAPDGYHDDAVISLALALQACKIGAPAQVFDSPFI